MDCADRPITDAVLTQLRGCAADALRALELPATSTSAERVAAVDRAVRRWQLGHPPAGVVSADVPFVLGSLWGQAVVDALPGWSWAEVTFRRHAGAVAVAVVSADRSLAIFPIHHVLACGDDPAAAVTVAAAFGQLLGGGLDGFTPGGYANVMDVV